MKAPTMEPGQTKGLLNPKKKVVLFLNCHPTGPAAHAHAKQRHLQCRPAPLGSEQAPSRYSHPAPATPLALHYLLHPTRTAAVLHHPALPARLGLGDAHVQCCAAHGYRPVMLRPR